MKNVEKEWYLTEIIRFKNLPDLSVFSLLLPNETSILDIQVYTFISFFFKGVLGNQPEMLFILTL